MPEAIETVIETAATDNVAEAETDGQKVKTHPLPDLIQADKHLDSKTAASKPHRGIRFTKLVPPGSV